MQIACRMTQMTVLTSQEARTHGCYCVKFQSIAVKKILNITKITRNDTYYVNKVEGAYRPIMNIS